VNNDYGDVNKHSGDVNNPSGEEPAAEPGMILTSRDQAF